MATLMRSFGTGGGGKPSIDREQLRHDRWVAAGVLALVAVLIALIVWLASMGGTTGVNDYYWMMP